MKAYSKCPKILYTKCSDKMTYAKNVDPDQDDVSCKLSPKIQILFSRKNKIKKKKFKMSSAKILTQHAKRYVLVQA